MCRWTVRCKCFKCGAVTTNADRATGGRTTGCHTRRMNVSMYTCLSREQILKANIFYSACIHTFVCGAAAGRRRHECSSRHYDAVWHTLGFHNRMPCLNTQKCHIPQTMQTTTIRLSLAAAANSSLGVVKAKQRWLFAQSTRKSRVLVFGQFFALPW